MVRPPTAIGQYAFPNFGTFYPYTQNWYDDSFCEHGNSNWNNGESDSFTYTKYGSLTESTYLWFHTNLLQRTDCMQAAGNDFVIKYASSYNYRLNGSPGSLSVSFLSRTIRTETEGWFTITPSRAVGTPDATANPGGPGSPLFVVGIQFDDADWDDNIIYGIPSNTPDNKYDIYRIACKCMQGSGRTHQPKATPLTASDLNDSECYRVMRNPTYMTVDQADLHPLILIYYNSGAGVQFSCTIPDI